MDLRNVVVAGLQARNPGAASALLHIPNPLDDLRPPLIFATFHIGPLHALEGFTARLSLPAVVVRRYGGDDQLGARVLLDALHRLEQGEFALFVVDGDGATIHVPFMGRTISFARGAFTLARISRVPILPMILAWRGDRAEVILGSAIPIPPEAGTSPEAAEVERALSSSVAAWLEAYLADQPRDISLRILSSIDGFNES